MAETMHRTRVFIEDSRANGLYLRTTWHPNEQQFVISTWDDTICTGAVRVPAAQAASLIALLADGLADAAAHPQRAPAPPAPARPPSVREALRGIWRRWAVPRSASATTHSVDNVVPLWTREDAG